MNDEIKEILNKLKYVVDNQIIEFETDYNPDNIDDNVCPLISNECKLLLDYITNLQHTEDLYNQLLKDYDELQQENERLKELCDKYEEEHNNEFQCWKRDRKELLDKRARIEKAVEITQNLLNTENSGYYKIIFQKQLDVLNGRSDE